MNDDNVKVGGSINEISLPQIDQSCLEEESNAGESRIEAAAAEGYRIQKKAGRGSPAKQGTSVNDENDVNLGNLEDVSSDKGYFEKRPSLTNSFMRQAACYEYQNEGPSKKSKIIVGGPFNNTQEALNSSFASSKMSRKSPRLS